MSKPCETKPRFKRGGAMFSWGVLLVAVPMFYLASAGPTLYLLNRTYGSLLNAPDPVIYSFLYFYYPAELIYKNFPPYEDYADWFVDKGEDAWRAEKEAAEQDQ